MNCYGFWDCNLNNTFFFILLPLIFIILAITLGILPMDCYISMVYVPLLFINLRMLANIFANFLGILTLLARQLRGHTPFVRPNHNTRQPVQSIIVRVCTPDITTIERARTPMYIPKRDQCVQFDARMEPAEEDFARQIDHIAGISPEMWPGFDQFGAENPQTEGPDPDWCAKEAGICHVGEVGPGYVDQRDVGYEGEVDER